MRSTAAGNCALGLNYSNVQYLAVGDSQNSTPSSTHSESVAMLGLAVTYRARKAAHVDMF